MKFVYQYRTSDNKSHKGVICAASKDAAYQSLKARGIRPGRVEEAPGFFNKFFGRGKRWTAIVLLAVLCAALCIVLLRLSKNQSGVVNVEDRAQLYGDPVVIGECEAAGWTNVFRSAFDAYLSRYAIPGRAVAFVRLTKTPDDPCLLLEISDTDLREVAQMKRMVNGMKCELREYLNAGGTVDGYVGRLDIRQRAEQAIVERTRKEIQRTDDVRVWKRENAKLRAMGLPMVGAEASENF